MHTNTVFAILFGLLLMIVVAVVCPFPAVADNPTPFSNCRLGVTVDGSPVVDPKVDELNLGWYGNFAPNSSPIPEGMEFIRTIRLNQVHGDPYDPAPGTCLYGVYSCYSDPPTYTLVMPSSFAELAQSATDNPGSMWAVGNEPDGRQWLEGGVWVGQDEIEPELYARAFCEISQVIRDSDPTARIAIGAVIQIGEEILSTTGTTITLRTEYLDRIWDEYPNVCNGRQLGDDVDMWNIHNYVLREVSRMRTIPGMCGSESTIDRSEWWGAEIPPGLYPEYCTGQWTSGEDNGDVDLAIGQIVRFRKWMADKGERNKPLIITEAGLNMGSYWVLPSQVKSFLTDYLDYVLNQQDPELGYPLDENRMVQRILWWSLNHNAEIDPKQEPGHACYPECTNHVDSLLGTVTDQAYRKEWVSYVTDQQNPEASIPRVGLFVTDTETIVEGDDPVTYTLRARVHNNGNTSASGGALMQFYEGTQSQIGPAIGSPQIVGQIRGCGEGVLVEQTWPDQPAGPIPVWSVAVVTIENAETVPPKYIKPAGPVTFTLSVDVRNSGSASLLAGSATVVFEGSRPGETTKTIGEIAIQDTITNGQQLTLEQPWLITGTPPVDGDYMWTASLHMDDLEIGPVLGEGIIASQEVYLPSVFKQW